MSYFSRLYAPKTDPHQGEGRADIGKWVRGAVAGLALGISAYASTAHAQEMRCGERKDLVGIAQEYGKARQVVSGIINEKEVIEIFSNDQGEWASYVTSTDGNMCTVDIGIHFRQYGDDQKIAGVKNSASNGAPMIRYRELGLSSIFRQQSF